jgi:hypothetical protein
VRFLPDERLYRDAEHCLRYLRELGGSDRDAPAPAERFHLYWSGPFGTKQAFAVKSLLATQDLERSELWLWLDAEDGYAGHEQNEILRPLAPYLRVMPFDPAAESRGTPVEDSPELYRGVDSVKRSDLFRWVTLYKLGGTYLDLDTMVLRDMAELFGAPSLPDEFCYQWSAGLPYPNQAVLRLRRQGEVGRAVLARCAEAGSCDPRVVLRFEDNERLDLAVLPCPFFDPLWPHVDRTERFKAAPFDRFDGFFREFGWRFRPRRSINSYRDFFAGAFTFHWHNQWDAPEHDDSYFGRFNREFDALLREGT